MQHLRAFSLSLSLVFGGAYGGVGVGIVVTIIGVRAFVSRRVGLRTDTQSTCVNLKEIKEGRFAKALGCAPDAGGGASETSMTHSTPPLPLSFSRTTSADGQETNINLSSRAPIEGALAVVTTVSYKISDTYPVAKVPRTEPFDFRFPKPTRADLKPSNTVASKKDLDVPASITEANCIADRYLQENSGRIRPVNDYLNKPPLLSPRDIESINR